MEIRIQNIVLKTQNSPKERKRKDVHHSLICCLEEIAYNKARPNIAYQQIIDASDNCQHNKHLNETIAHIGNNKMQLVTCFPPHPCKRQSHEYPKDVTNPSSPLIMRRIIYSMYSSTHTQLLDLPRSMQHETSCTEQQEQIKGFPPSVSTENRKKDKRTGQSQQRCKQRHQIDRPGRRRRHGTALTALTKPIYDTGLYHVKTQQ